MPEVNQSADNDETLDKAARGVLERLERPTGVTQVGDARMGENGARVVDATRAAGVDIAALLADAGVDYVEPPVATNPGQQGPEDLEATGK